MFNNTIKSWDEDFLLVLNSDKYKELYDSNKIKNFEEQWYEGPLNLIFGEILFFFKEQSFE